MKRKKKDRQILNTIQMKRVALYIHRERENPNSLMYLLLLLFFLIITSCLSVICCCWKSFLAPKVLRKNSQKSHFLLKKKKPPLSHSSWFPCFLLYKLQRLEWFVFSFFSLSKRVDKPGVSSARPWVESPEVQWVRKCHSCQARWVSSHQVTPT